MLEALNGRAASDREALHADLAVAKSAERDVRERASLLDGQLAQAAEREKALVDRLSAELTDKAAGAEALAALERPAGGVSPMPARQRRVRRKHRRVRGVHEGVWDVQGLRSNAVRRARSADAGTPS